MLEYTIGKNDAEICADKFLLKATGAPSSIIYKAFRKKDVKINGKWIKSDYVLKTGDVLRIYIKEDFRVQKSFTPCAVTAEAVYEDENIVILNKPVNVPCQPDAMHKTGTLADMLKSYLYNKGEYFPDSENSFSPALCNRLDTNTSGLVIGAKNAQALREMNELIRKRLVHKFYLCRAEGMPPKKEQFVKTHIIKEEKQNKSYISDTGGKEIAMEYKVLDFKNNISTIEVLLHTGRSHQIRAYFASVGCPLCGDKKYGAKSSGGQNLTAYKIVFDFNNESCGLLSYLDKKTVELQPFL